MPSRCECKQMQMAPSLALCVVNYQGRDVLAATLAAASAQVPPPAEIVLVDNASTDGSIDLVRTRFPAVRIVQLAENGGPGPARNAGYRATTAGLVGFIDNDVMPEPDCFALLAAGLAARAPRWPCPASSMPTPRDGSSSRARAPTI